MIDKISVMIVDDDETYAKEIASYVKSQEDMVSAGYALNGEEALELAAVTSPDVIILDILMPKLDGMGFLRRLHSTDNKKTPAVIVMSMSSMPSIVNTAISNGADYFMVKPQPFHMICDTIRDLTAINKITYSAAEQKKVQEPYNSLEKYVTEFLKQLGIPAHLDGYKYMRQAIILSVDDMSLLNPITKKLYPLIADHYGTNKSCVERAMRHAINVSWSRGNKKIFQDIFGYTIEDNKRRPTNSEYIAMAADDFRIRLKYGMIQ